MRAVGHPPQSSPQRSGAPSVKPGAPLNPRAVRGPSYSVHQSSSFTGLPSPAGAPPLAGRGACAVDVPLPAWRTAAAVAGPGAGMGGGATLPMGALSVMAGLTGAAATLAAASMPGIAP